MEIAKVIGTIVCTIKHPAYQGKKLLMVQPLALENQTPPAIFIAIDEAQAGIGDTVLILREGGGARQITGIKDAPIISVIVGILDTISILTALE